MKYILLSTMSLFLVSISSFAGTSFADSSIADSNIAESAPTSAVVDELQQILGGNPLVSADEGEDLDCQKSPPPGGWTSFPLACRRFVGRLQVASDPDFHHIITSMAIEQKGRLKRNFSGEVEYYFSIKLGPKQMQSEKVVWQADRSYEIGQKIRGLCVAETDAPVYSSVVCRAGFHGAMGRVAGGYVETYYGPGITQIHLESANSQEGRTPLLHWRASLSEAK